MLAVKDDDDDDKRNKRKVVECYGMTLNKTPQKPLWVSDYSTNYSTMIMVLGRT